MSTCFAGQFLDDEQHGRGVVYYANGDSFKGSFFHDEIHGPGIYTYADGRKEMRNYEHDVVKSTGPADEGDTLLNAAQSAEKHTDSSTAATAQAAFVLPALPEVLKVEVPGMLMRSSVVQAYSP